MEQSLCYCYALVLFISVISVIGVIVRFFCERVDRLLGIIVYCYWFSVKCRKIRVKDGSHR